MNWFKESVPGQQKVKRMAKGVRQRLFLIAGRLVTRSRRRLLRLSPSWPWKEDYLRAGERLEALKLPLPA